MSAALSVGMSERFKGIPFLLFVSAKPTFNERLKPFELMFLTVPSYLFKVCSTI